MNFPQGFFIDTALELAGLSKEAYKQFDHGSSWTGPTGYKLLKTFNAVYEGKNVPIGFIAAKADDLYVSWRGTDSLKEWIEDAKFDQIPCDFLPGKVNVELGFYELYAMGGKPGAGKDLVETPQQVVIEFLKNNPSTGKVYVTGHSLGAALAVLNCLDILKNTPNQNVVLYNFAGPRAGSPQFAEIYNEAAAHSWRVVNPNDEVPKLPMENTFGNHFQHVEKEFDVTFGGSFPWEWGDDHSLDNYISHLSKGKSAIS
jgi:triacylglycerol lipase